MTDALDSFILHLATERGLSTNYQLLVRRVLEALASWLKQDKEVEDISAVTTQHLTDYLARRKKDGLAASSARVELVAIKIFFRWLAARGKRQGDPAEPLLPPRQEKHLPDTLNEATAQQLVESITGTEPLDRRDRAMLELFYASGLRLSELVNARDRKSVV
jgi:integrase/recombinase XerD